MKEVRRLSFGRGERQRQRKTETDRREMGKASRTHLALPQPLIESERINAPLVNPIRAPTSLFPVIL